MLKADKTCTSNEEKKRTGAERKIRQGQESCSKWGKERREGKGEEGRKKVEKQVKPEDEVYQVTFFSNVRLWLGLLDHKGLS